MNQIKVVICILLVAFGGFAFSQNNTCANASPFCTGQTMNFPAGVNAGSAQSGPNYGCLGSEPNPAWFFMQMANSGSMSISMSAANDIDFICWGPFTNLTTACGNLTSGNIQSCSYSSSATETCTIANAVPGAFYLMLITNYSNSVQNITFNQNNQGGIGAATTNCGFVCVVSGTTSGAVCAGQNATISLGPGTSTSVISYTWTGPSSFSSNLGTNVLSNVQSNMTFTIAGTNSAVINGAAYSGTCQSIVTVSVVPYPTFNLTLSIPSPTICQGGSFNAGVTFVPLANPANYTYNWSPSSGAGVWNPYVSSTLISPIPLPTTTPVDSVLYSVTVSPAATLATCPTTKSVMVKIYNPLTPTINPIPPLCDSSPQLQLTASPPGGVWSAGPIAGAITTTGLFNPAVSVANPISNVTYSVSAGACTVSVTKTVSTSKYYSPALTTGISTLCVQDGPFNLMNIVQNTLTGKWISSPPLSPLIANTFTPSGLATGAYNLTYSTNSSPNPTACAAFTVLVVNVFNPPVPIISAISPSCTNAGTINLTATPIGGVWSGAAGISPSGVLTPSNSPVSSTIVAYTAGQGTCVASSSRTFQISQYNSPVLTGTVPHLCVSSNPFNLMNIVFNNTGSWNNGPGVYNNANVFNPANLPTGIYNLVYHTTGFPNTNLCHDSSKIAVSVLNPPTPAITKVGPFCSTDSPIQLTVTPNTGYWVPSSFLSANGTFSPALSPVGNNGVQYVIGTSTCNAQQTKIISTEAFVSAALTASLGDLCSTGAQINLLPITLSNSGNWSGPGITGTSFNPGTSGAGTFTLTYHTSSTPSGLCPDKSALAVNVFSLATPVISKAGPFCNNSLPSQLLVSPVGGLFGSGLVGAVSGGGLFNPALAMIGDNVISYSISSGPCVANAHVNIAVEKFVSADFAKYAETAYCINNLPFNLNSLVENPGGSFMGGPAVVPGGSMFDPFKANLGENIITYQTHSLPTALCMDTKTISLKVKGIPVVTASSNTYTGCAPVEVVLKSLASESGIGVWNLNDGSEAQQGSTISHIYTSPGSYSVVLSYADGEAKSCSTQVFLPVISVNEMPHADFIFSPDEITIDNPEVTFTNLSTTLKDNRYTWTIEKLNQSSDVNPVINFPQIGNYKVTLTATTNNGCKSEISKTIEIKNDFNVFIPNSFTPNYDNINDVFKPVFSPYGLDTKTYSLEIFNRWGKELFSTKDYTKGWDGTVQNKGDEALKPDVYIYKVRYKDLNGQAYDQIGDVTLIK